jgi:hypothetical protein
VLADHVDSKVLPDTLYTAVCTHLASLVLLKTLLNLVLQLYTYGCNRIHTLVQLCTYLGAKFSI